MSRQSDSLDDKKVKKELYFNIKWHRHRILSY